MESEEGRERVGKRGGPCPHPARLFRRKEARQVAEIPSRFSCALSNLGWHCSDVCLAGHWQMDSGERNGSVGTVRRYHPNRCGPGWRDEWSDGIRPPPADSQVVTLP